MESIANNVGNILQPLGIMVAQLYGVIAATVDGHSQETSPLYASDEDAIT